MLGPPLHTAKRSVILQAGGASRGQGGVQCPTRLRSVTQTVEPSGELTSLGLVETRPYERIRVLADCRSASTGSAEITISFVEGEGAPGWLDRYVVAPGAAVGQVYDVPGVILTYPHSRRPIARRTSTDLGLPLPG